MGTHLIRNFPVPQAHLCCLGAGLAAELVTGWTISLPPWLRLGGAGLVGAGLAWAAYATWACADTHLADPDRLVLRGPYATRRNPMYVGWTLAYVGTVVVLASAWLLLFLPGVLFLTHIAVRREEMLLRARFGAAYASYVATTRRYL